jgi:hypothetical protein
MHFLAANWHSLQAPFAVCSVPCSHRKQNPKSAKPEDRRWRSHSKGPPREPKCMPPSHPSAAVRKRGVAGPRAGLCLECFRGHSSHLRVPNSGVHLLSTPPFSAKSISH